MRVFPHGMMMGMMTRMCIPSLFLQSRTSADDVFLNVGVSEVRRSPFISLHVFQALDELRSGISIRINSYRA